MGRSWDIMGGSWGARAAWAVAAGSSASQRQEAEHCGPCNRRASAAPDLAHWGWLAKPGSGALPAGRPCVGLQVAARPAVLNQQQVRLICTICLHDAKGDDALRILLSHPPSCLVISLSRA